MMKSNILISEFMGYVYEDATPAVELPPYHKSWDWLMPVVKECYKHKYKDALLNAHCVFISAALQTVDRKTIYETIVNFIEAYNNGTIR
jgi:hypothetical protein